MGRGRALLKYGAGLVLLLASCRGIDRRIVKIDTGDSFKGSISVPSIFEADIAGEFHYSSEPVETAAPQNGPGPRTGP